ncbi:flagellar motor switch protein FliN, partial [Geotalea toluenoxydans]|uniref:flagellar motor switch protein FliN n=2 Tax=Geotalea TaxID=2910589 RepID=UPI002436E3CB
GATRRCRSVGFFREGRVVTETGELEEQKNAEMKNLDFILDIPLQLTVELGRTKLLVKDILQLNQGAVVELSKLAGEPLDVFVNSKLVARGEAVVINDKFGIRLVDIVSPNERVEKAL